MKVVRLMVIAMLVIRLESRMGSAERSAGRTLNEPSGAASTFSHARNSTDTPLSRNNSCIRRHVGSLDAHPNESSSYVGLTYVSHKSLQLIHTYLDIAEASHP